MNTLDPVTAKRIRKVYQKALKDVIAQNRGWIKKYEKVLSGAIQPPLMYTLTGREQEWRDGFIRQIARTDSLVESMRNELRKAGQQAVNYIQQGMAQAYTDSRRATIAQLEEGLGMRINFGLLNRKAVETIVRNHIDHAPYTKIAFRNLGSNTKVV